jgi:hypothetical protein
VNFKRTAALVAATTTVLTAAGCGNMPGTATGLTAKAGTYNAAAKRKAEKGGSWTVLIHMAAENNLYRFGLEDLNEMEAGVPEGDSVNVYVLFDGIKDGDSAIYKVKRDSGMNSTIISEKVDASGVIPASNEIDSGDAKVAAKFVQWAAKNAPADHTFLGYWDHGSGLFSGGPQPITKGFGWDDKGSHMSTNDITDIAAAFKATSGKPLAVLGFDACLMAHGEIAYQAKGSVDYLVSSEELEPGKGWDYAGWLKRVGASDKTPAAVASALVDSYGASYAPGGSQTSGRDAATLSAVDVNAFNNNVVPALNTFVGAVSRDMASHKVALQAARAKAQSFYNKDCADLGSFLNNVRSTVKNDDVTRASDDLLAAYKSAIVRETHTSGFPGATGLVLYFPTPTQRINAVYNDASKIAFAATSWKDFLANYR